jgi:hypothetical protein
METKIKVRKMLSLWIVYHRTGSCGVGGVVNWSDSHAEAIAMADQHIKKHREDFHDEWNRSWEAHG